MSELFSQLGINGELLLAQAVNFAILLVVLTIFVYKPLAKVLEARRQKIEFGIKGADLAEAKMTEATQHYQQKIKEADKEAVKIIGQAEARAGERKEEIVAEAQKKSETILAEAKITAEKKKIEALDKLSKEAADLIKAAIIRTVELDPKAIDDKLVLQAVEQIKSK